MGWSDYHSDWSSEESLIEADEYKLLEAIALAVNERSVFAGLSELSINHLTTVRDRIIALNSRIKQLIPLFGRIVDGEYKPWTESEIKNYGIREDGSIKGMGYFGEIYMTTGEYDFATEISIEADGIFGPSLVPTLTDDEVKFLLAGNNPTSPIIQKAVAYAAQRIAQGKSPFAQDGEQSPRSWMPGFTSPLVTIKEWLKLMYGVINKLLILKITPSIANTHNLGGFGQSIGNIDKDIALADAVEKCWSHLSPHGSEFDGSAINSIIRNVGTYWSSVGRSSECAVFFDVDSELTFIFDLYIWAEKAIYFGGEFFDSCGLGYTEGWNKISVTVADAETVINIGDATLIPSYTFNIPSPADTGSSGWKEDSSKRYALITGNFKFIAGS